MGKDGPAPQVILGSRATVIRGEDWKMTDDKCPLSKERLEELEANCWGTGDNGGAEAYEYLIIEALRQAAVEAYKIGHEEGYQAATEFIATGE